MFLERPFTEPINDRGQYELRTRLVYVTRGYKLIVPKGFITDFASVPRWAWSIITPTGLHQDAAVLHDYLYQYEGRPRTEDVTLTELERPWPCRFTRVECDNIFYEAMRELGVGWFKAWAMAKAVNIFGGFAW